MYLKDVRICFGLRNAPFLFTTISNFIVRCMARRGFDCIVNYLDDFIVVAPDFETCQSIQMELISLSGSLGFIVSWKKCSSPSTFCRYLGIDIDSTTMQLSLPDDKMIKLHEEMSFFCNRTRAKKRQLQRLCGVLSHCSKVIKGARTFSRRVIDLLKGLGDGNPRVRLTDGFLIDLQWWRDFASIFNGVSCCIPFNHGDGHTIFTDSSQHGYGIHTNGDWQAGWFDADCHPSFSRELNPLHNHWVNVDSNSSNIKDRQRWFGAA